MTLSRIASDVKRFSIIIIPSSFLATSRLCKFTAVPSLLSVVCLLFSVGFSEFSSSYFCGIFFFRSSHAAVALALSLYSIVGLWVLWTSCYLPTSELQRTARTKQPHNLLNYCFMMMAVSMWRWWRVCVCVCGCYSEIILKTFFSEGKNFYNQLPAMDVYYILQHKCIRMNFGIYCECVLDRRRGTIHWH